MRIIEGRQKIFKDNQVFTQETNRQNIIANIQKRISETEPLRLRNWLRHGFRTVTLDKNTKKKLFKCLKSLPNDKLLQLFRQSTNLYEMPLGGARRLEKITVREVQFDSDIFITSNIWTLGSQFTCEGFKRQFNID
jgi:hypothetical protein